MVFVANHLSIVAVHGLGGHWKDTWTEGEKLWLRDFLPDQLREVSVNARIMSYGYNATTAFSSRYVHISYDLGFVGGLQSWQTVLRLREPPCPLSSSFHECLQMTVSMSILMLTLESFYSVAGIEDQAIALLTELNLERQFGAETERPLIFVAHSLGGIVVKKVNTAC